MCVCVCIHTYIYKYIGLTRTSVDTHTPPWRPGPSAAASTRFAYRLH